MEYAHRGSLLRKTHVPDNGTCVGGQRHMRIVYLLYSVVGTISNLEMFVKISLDIGYFCFNQFARCIIINSESSLSAEYR